MKGKLILENGMVFNGKMFGEVGEAVGELIFHTGMAGYQELLTDPSYAGQMVVMTYPMIGNYGINLEDMESDKIHLQAFILKEEAKLPNNFRCEMSLEGFLRQHKIVAFKGIDTRYLSQILREEGSMKALVTNKDLTKKEIEERFQSYVAHGFVDRVSTKVAYTLGEGEQKLAVLDFGVKRSVLQSFVDRGYAVKVFPWNTKAEELLDYGMNALLLPNGPGNPEELDAMISVVKACMEQQCPVLGIGMGALVLARALGAKTKKMKLGHHGANHPVKDLSKDRIYISSQKQEYMIEALPTSCEMTHVSMSDNTIQGFQSTEWKAMAVQFQPEGSDLAHTYDEFVSFIKEAK